MSQISRLRNDEISNGNVINADDIDAELNQLVTESNSQDSRITGLESGNVTITGNKTLSGEITFSNAANPVKTDLIKERTPDAGVEVDGVLLKDGTVRTSIASDPALPVNGDLWYNSTSNQLKARINGVTHLLQKFPSRWMQGPAVQYVSASQVKIPAGFACRDVADTFDIIFSADATAALTVSGANGLDTGAEAASTWYYIYVIADSTGGNGASGLLSTVNEAASGSITMPSGYDKKRQLPIAIRNNSSSNIIKFYVGAWGPGQTEVFYDVPLSRYESGYVYGSSTTGTNVVNAGTATTWTAVSLSNFVPPISRLAYLNALIANADGAFHFRPTGGSMVIAAGYTAATGQHFPIPTSSSRSVDYIRNIGSAALGLDVYGYTVTEVF